jgi:hypothetical protein
LVALDEELEEPEEAVELVLDVLELAVESDFLVSEELFDSLDDVDDGVSVVLAVTVLDDLASERASLR